MCDIYRIEDGKLAEHWDVVEHNVQDIVPITNNGLFRWLKIYKLHRVN